MTCEDCLWMGVEIWPKDRKAIRCWHKALKGRVIETYPVYADGHTTPPVICPERKDWRR